MRSGGLLRADSEVGLFWMQSKLENPEPLHPQTLSPSIQRPLNPAASTFHAQPMNYSIYHI